MSLPILDNDNSFIKTKLPSGKNIGIRGWKIKDEKNLMFKIDSDSDFEKNKLNYVLEFFKNCTNNPELFDSLSEQDIKKIAIEIRKLSKGDTIEYNYHCPNCKNKLLDEVSLTKNTIIKEFDKSPAIINDNLTIVFKEISYIKAKELLEEYGVNSSRYDFYVVLNSIEGLTYKNETFTIFTLNELEDFLDQFDSDDMIEIYKEFKSRLSSVKLERTVKCHNPNCQKEINMNYGNLLSFLVL
ncbi:hypothetical protein GW796_05935 [archaeon]|nr:hypothetical protein [archaeon]NCQ51424.1 hypothetical protein [archaeon]NCT58750.1 hypothetical protein [archaeon]